MLQHGGWIVQRMIHCSRSGNSDFIHRPLFKIGFTPRGEKNIIAQHTVTHVER